MSFKQKEQKLLTKKKTAFEGQVKAFQKFIQDSQTKLSKEEFTRFQAIETTMNNAISEVAKAGNMIMYLKLEQ